MGRCCRVPVIKLLELIFGIACMVLHLLSLQPEDSVHTSLLSITYLTYAVIQAGVIFGAIIGDHVPSHIDSLYSVVGAGMFLASGIVSLQFWDDEPRELFVVRTGIWKGVLSCINSVLFVIDAFIELRGSDICAGIPYSD